MEPFAAYQQREYTKGETEIIAAIGFDYDQIDRDLLDEYDPETPETQKLKADWGREGRSSASADLLKQTLEALLPANTFGAGTSKAMGLRCLCLLWMLQSDRHDLGSRSLADLAKSLKLSRAILSFHVRSLEEQLGFYHARGQKAVEARESYKESVKAGWETRRAKHGKTGRKASNRSGESPPNLTSSTSHMFSTPNNIVNNFPYKREFQVDGPPGTQNMPDEKPAKPAPTPAPAKTSNE